MELSAGWLERAVREGRGTQRRPHARRQGDLRRDS